MLNQYISTQSPIVASTGFLVGEEESDTLKRFWQSTEVLLKFAHPTREEKRSGIPETLITEQQLPAFPSYNEEDILNLDAVIITPPPRESGTIRVKLIYEEPSKPIPVEDPWE